MPHVPTSTRVTLRHIARHVLDDWRTLLWRLLDSILIPLALFRVTYALAGVWVGLGAATAWPCLRLLMRWRKGEPSGLMLLAAVGQLLRLGVALLLASPDLWVFQGVAHTAGMGAVLAATGARGPSSLIDTTLRDTVPWAQKLLGSSHAAYSRSLALLWGFEQIVLAGANLFIATRVHISTYLALKPLIGWACAAPTLAISIVRLRNSARNG